MRYQVSHKETGAVLFEGEASSSEEALLKMEAEAGCLPVSVFDSTSPHPTWKHFDSYADALKTYVAEALAHIKEVRD